MMKRNSWMAAATAALAISGFSTYAVASSHSEAPGTASDPDIDNADVWAWREGANLIIVATYNGLQPPFAAPNWKKFSDEAIYEIHLARGPMDLKDALTYQIAFKTAPYPIVDPADLAKPVGGGKEFYAQLSGGGAFNQTYSVTKIEAGKNPVVLVMDGKVAPPNAGPRTNAIAFKIPNGTTYEQYFVDNAATSVIKSLGNGEGRVFAGPRDDPFFVDLGAVFDLAGLRPVIGGNARDSVRYTNVNTIALEIPLTVANGGQAPMDNTALAKQTVGVWASASRRKVHILRADGTNDNYGPFRQVSRLGLPLINEAVIGLQDKDRWNRKTPADDAKYFAPYFLNPPIVRVAEFAGFYANGGPLAACAAMPGLPALKANRTDIIDLINLKNIPGNGDHSGAEAIASIGDVLRVDLGFNGGGFPNGRKFAVDVTDIELTFLLCHASNLGKVVVPDGVAANETPTKGTFPFAAAPWDSFAASPYVGPAF